MLVKVCGMRDPDNIRAVEASGADWMGFIFYERSPRFVSSPPAYLPESVKRVGVFVNSPYEYILRQGDNMKLDIIQLHGNETPQMCRRLQEKGYKIIKSFSLENVNDLQKTGSYTTCCDYFLFDTPCSSYGGSGKKFNWDLLAEYQGEIPFILSGGLNPDSLDDLKQFNHPRWAGIDLNSGFETSPALKDIKTLKTFIKNFKTSAL